MSKTAASYTKFIINSFFHYRSIDNRSSCNFIFYRWAFQFEINVWFDVTCKTLPDYISNPRIDDWYWNKSLKYCPVKVIKYVDLLLFQRSVVKAIYSTDSNAGKRTIFGVFFLNKPVKTNHLFHYRIVLVFHLYPLRFIIFFTYVKIR